jgi:replication factor C large subunit
MWSSEYRPDTLSEIVGNRDQVKKLSEWADSWEDHREAVVLHGSPGVGKTTSAYALGKDKKWEIIEMNASDKRTGDIVERIAGESSKTASLTGKKRKLVILDEADNLHGNSDRGGKSAITRIIKDSEQPIILIANDYYELTRTIRNNTQDIEYDHIGESEIANTLQKICESRGIEYEVEALKMIAEGADGDLRGAINDLQKNATGKERIDTDDIDTVGRDQKQEIFPFLDLTLKEASIDTVRAEYRNLDMTPDELMRWMNQNMYREYTKDDEILVGLESMSRADVWLGRTTETQNYKYWRYASDSLSAGVASAREGKHGGWTRWQPPRYRRGSGVSDDIVSGMALSHGASMRTIRKDIIPYSKTMISYCKPRETTVSMVAKYNLDEKSLSEISGSGKSTNKVQDIVEEGNKLAGEFEIETQSSETQQKPQKNLNEEDGTIGNEEYDMVEIVSRAKSVGSKTAKNVKKKFESLDKVRNAGIDELSDVSGVSTKRAERIIDIIEGLDEGLSEDSGNKNVSDAKSEDSNDENGRDNKSSSKKGEKNENQDVGLDDFM